MKKRVLIISYHFPPKASVASLRAEAMASQLVKQGFDVGVLTHLFIDAKRGRRSAAEQSEIDAQLPYKVYRSTFSAQIPLVAKWPLIRKAYIFQKWATGHFDIYSSGLDSYKQMKRQLWEVLSEESYDFVLGIFSPHHNLRLCAEQHAQFGVPYSLDFRDLWSVQANSPGYEPKGVEAMQVYWIKKYWERWTRKALFLSSISGPMANFLSVSFGKDTLVCTNGFYQGEYLSHKKEEFNTSGSLEILYTGTLYEEQHLSVFFSGISKWLSGSGKRSVKMQFIGTKKASHKRILDEAKKHHIVNSIELVEKKPRSEVLQRLAEADLLFYPGWPDRPGVYSSKLFEYLAASKPVLQCPSDKNVIADLLKRSRAGLSTNDPDQVTTILEELWEAKKRGVRPAFFDPQERVIAFHSWENQMELLAQHIYRHIDQ